ncbi:MAG: zinc dependent phospholipase C family protein [Bacteroidota bacterium]
MKFPLASLLLFLSVLLPTGSSLPWGYRSHEEIHRRAIKALPPDARSFFEHHALELIERSTEADKRRFADKSESRTHYINVDRYGKYPFSDLPHSYEDAIAKFGKDSVDAGGTVPWRIAEFTRGLTEAFMRNDTSGIIFYAANLGHYVADAHVPLHATVNYDGQLSGQHGVHARWESRLPEKYLPSYDLEIRPARLITDPLEHAFGIVLNSFQKVDSVLAADKKALESLPINQRFVERKSKGKVVYEYRKEYYERFHGFLNGMVERQLENAIQEVASYWYTAWVNAKKTDKW